MAAAERGGVFDGVRGHGAQGSVQRVWSRILQGTVGSVASL